MWLFNSIVFPLEDLENTLVLKKPDTFYEHAMIAATARINNSIELTVNVADFKPLGVEVFSPFGKKEHRLFYR